MGNWQQFPKKIDHHTWVEISKSAINHNIAQYKKFIGDKILAPVIKGNAYGHGIVEVGRICQENDLIAWLCVANLTEALLLRKHGIKKNILVLSYLGPLQNKLLYDPLVEQAALKKISLVTYDMDTIKQLDALGRRLNTRVNIHIKVDTGLSRLGIEAHNAMAFVLHIEKLKNIHIEGIWTHFAESPSEDRTFTNQQAHKFLQLIEELKQKGIVIPFVHSCNSSGIPTVNLACDNFFRLGIGLYGYWTTDYVKRATQTQCPEFSLMPTLTWKSPIFCIKHIKKNSFVGYDRTYQVKKDSKIAVIPVGYYDGYNRRLSNIGSVIIRGQVAPIVGIICMNVCTVDVTHIKEVQVGDEAILLGNAHGVTVNEIATLGNVNPREITTKINPEIPRIITK